MPLHPEVEAFLARAAASGGPSRAAMTPAQTREFYRGMAPLAGEPPELAAVEDRAVPGGAGEIPVRLYRPSSRTLPLLVYFHGGRFFSGDLETHDPVCRILANLSGWIVAAVDYRLAPEHLFPAALEDAQAATVWIGEHAGELGADPTMLGVGGDSAGGNLAAATALALRDSGPPLQCQMLIYPMLDATCGMATHQSVGSGYGPGSEDMKRGYREYLPDGVSLRDPRVSPLWQTDLSGLPPAYVLTAEYDSLRDEGEAYARALEEADVPVTAARFEGMIHGFFQMGGVFSEGRRANAEAAGFLRAVSGQ
jgi:acetyl esterase/lipase